MAPEVGYRRNKPFHNKQNSKFRRNNNSATLKFSEFYEDKPILIVEIAGKKVYALLDTGAENCLVDESCVSLRQIKSKKMAVSVKSPVSDNIMHGTKTLINVEIAGRTLKQPVCVVRFQQRVAFQMILGFDWCAQYEAIIDCDKRTVKLQFSNRSRDYKNSQSQDGTNFCCGTTMLHKDKASEQTNELYGLFKTNELGLSDEYRQQLENILDSHKNILIEDVTNMTGANVPPYEPKFKTETPIYQRQYRIPHSLYEPLRIQLDKLEKANIIKKIHSPYNSPVLVLPKKDSKEVRICLDLRKINKQIVDEQYPIMRIADILENLGGARIFSSLDLNNGYFNVKLTEEAQKKFAFSVPFAKYTFTRLCQGCVTSAAVFQKIMVECLHDIILKGHVFVYLDDIIIHSPNIDDHLKTLEEVLTALEKVNLAVKPSKCHLFKESIKYLGHMVDKNGCRPIERSVEAIQKLARPTTVRGVRSFLGSLNFYRKFITNFAEIAAPLYDLLKKRNVAIKWNEDAEFAFQTLKQKLTTAPLLAFPNYNKHFIIKTDASLTSIGAVLEQENDKGEVQPIAYASRRLNQAERNYAVIERETLAIVFAIEQFQHMTYGNKIVLLTDHKPLTYIVELKNTNSRVARWMMCLQQHNIHYEYLPGKLNSFADMLSRSHVEGETTATCAIELTKRPITVELMQTEQQKDDFCKDTISKLKEDKIADKTYLLDDDNLLKKLVQLGNSEFTAYRTVVPASLIPDVLFAYHDSIIGGHNSLEKTIYRIKRNFFWPTLFTDIKNYIHSCEKCQRRNRGRVKAPIQAVEPPSSCMFRLSIDILGPFSTTQRRNKYIITYTDHFSRMTFASPLPSQEAHIIAADYMKTIYTRYGGSKYILSDRGPQLVGHIMTELYKRLGIERITTTSFWPRSNGISERINTKILNLIAHYCNKEFNDWDVMLPYLMQVINNTVHSSTKQVPFYIFHGFYQFDAFTEFNLNENIDNLDRIDLVDAILERLETAKSEVFANLQNASITYARRKDRGRHLREFDIGELVLALDIPSYSGHNRKLNPRYVGPYTVIKRTGMANYHIQDVSNPNKVKQVHVDKLKAYFQRKVIADDEAIDTRVALPEPVIANIPSEEADEEAEQALQLKKQEEEYIQYMKILKKYDSTSGLDKQSESDDPIDVVDPELKGGYFLRKRNK